MKLTKEDILAFFEGHHLHIGDGVDDCRGSDPELMWAAAADLANMIEKKPPQCQECSEDLKTGEQVRCNLAEGHEGRHVAMKIRRVW